MKKDGTVNISDKYSFDTQFYGLNDKMNITLESFKFGIQNLTLGKYIRSGIQLDVDTMEFTNMNFTIRVEHFLNPWIGLCYAIIPGPSLKWGK